MIWNAFGTISIIKSISVSPPNQEIIRLSSYFKFCSNYSWEPDYYSLTRRDRYSTD